MARRTPLQTLVLSVLVATLTCTQLLAPGLAQADKGQNKNQGKRQEQKSDHGRSEDQRQSRDDQHNNGQKSQQSSSRRSQQSNRALSPEQAAQIARSQYDGQVLKVSPSGQGYLVRLLQDDGRVVTVPIGD
jgi:uncharacterized membrane protein YkoI